MEWDHNHNERCKNRLMSIVFAVLRANCRSGGVLLLFIRGCLRGYYCWNWLKNRSCGESALFVNLKVVESSLNQKKLYMQELKKYGHSLQSYVIGMFCRRFFWGEMLLEKSPFFLKNNVLLVPKNKPRTKKKKSFYKKWAIIWFLAYCWPPKSLLQSVAADNLYCHCLLEWYWTALENSWVQTIIGYLCIHPTLPYRIKKKSSRNPPVLSAFYLRIQE
jgi:hypothetical protein